MGAGHAHRSHRADRGHHHAGAEVEIARGPRAVLLSLLTLAAAAAVAGLVLLWPNGSEVGKITESVPFAAPGVTFPNAEVDAVHPPCDGPADRTGPRTAACWTSPSSRVPGRGTTRRSRWRRTWRSPAWRPATR